MKRKHFLRLKVCLTVTVLELAGMASAAPAGKLPLDRWAYIQVDDSRAKWGDFAKPDWLKYYGLSTGTSTAMVFLMSSPAAIFTSIRVGT